MYSEIGASALALSWLVALMGIGVSGWLITRRVRVDARWNSAISIMVYLNFMLLLLAALALWAALLNQQYQLRFVWETTAPATPHHLRISALWGRATRIVAFLVVTDERLHGAGPVHPPPAATCAAPAGNDGCPGGRGFFQWHHAMAGESFFAVLVDRGILRQRQPARFRVAAGAGAGRGTRA